MSSISKSNNNQEIKIKKLLPEMLQPNYIHLNIIINLFVKSWNLKAIRINKLAPPQAAMLL